MNSEVYQGLNLTNTLIDVLLRFRQDRIAISGDIDAAFLQGKIKKKHQNVLRFVWWAKNDMIREPNILIITSHLLGRIWSPSIANSARGRKAEDNKEYFSDYVIKTFYKDVYVDDCLHSLESEVRSIKRVKYPNRIAEKGGGFWIRKLLSNRTAFLKRVPKGPRQRCKGLSNYYQLTTTRTNHRFDVD